MDKRIVNVDTDDSQSSEVARALGYSGEVSKYTWSGPLPETLRVFPALGEPLLCISTTNEPPPLVPTPEAVETWGWLWWRQVGGTADVVSVMHFAADSPVAPLGFYEPMSRTPRQVVADCFWAGPVLERPAKP